MASFSRLALEDYLKTLDIKAGRVLDCGSGQQSIKKRTKSFDVKELVGLDLEKPHEGNKQDIVCDLNEVYRFKSYESYFDIAFCVEVSEYLWNPVQAFKNMNWFIKKGGILYVSFHTVYPIHQPDEFDSIRLTPSGARKILEETGFEILEVVPRKFRHIDSYMDLIVYEGMRQSKTYEMHGWSGFIIKARKK